MSSDNNEALAARARQMRAEGATYGQIKQALGLGSSTVARLLGTAGTGKPRRRVSEERRALARELRENGWSVPDISRKLGIAKSTAFQLTQGIAYEVSAEGVARRRKAAREYWDAQNAKRDADRNEAHRAAMDDVGELSTRDLQLIGAALYWAEGSKSKPWRRSERLTFVNSDPDVIRVYLAWLRLLGVNDDRLKYRVHIHESADVRAAEEHWAEVVGVPASSPDKTMLKKHNPRTRRKNVGDGYRGCLIVQVRRSQSDYWRMAGLWKGIVASVKARQLS